jgi:hypothetical protein
MAPPRFLRDLEQDFVRDYDGLNLPSGEKDIAFRVGRMEQTLAKMR